MVNCAVLGCANYPHKKNCDKRIKYYGFPKDKNLCEKWISACGRRESINVKNARICAEHFEDNNYKLLDIYLGVPEGRRGLKKDAVPTRNLYHCSSSESSKKHQKDMQKSQNFVMDLMDSCERLQDSDEFIGNSPTDSEEVATVQTDEDNKDLQIKNLKSELRHLKAKHLKCIKRLHVSRSQFCGIKGIMSNRQIKKLVIPEKEINWESKDILSAMALYSAGPKAYRMLCKRHYPLPNTATLLSWSSKFQLKSGILNNALHLMSISDYNEKERLCVLSFDEMEIRSSYDYTKSNDDLSTDGNFVQVVMVRGLLKNWKQVIYFELDRPMNFTLLKTILQKLEDINFNVVAIVSDMGPTSLALWRELNISKYNPSFINPNNSSNIIYVFADVPSLLKLLRNYFLNNGFILNGKNITIKPIIDVLLLEKSDFKVSHQNLSVTTQPKVDFVKEPFSYSIYNSIRKYIALGKITSQNALECSNFIKIVNDWFQVLNSKDHNSREEMKAYGLDLQKQQEIISSMNKTIQKLRISQKPMLVPCQKGILLTNSSLPLFFKYVNTKYNIQYIMTNKLNLDGLELFFETIRSKNGLHQHPTPLEFKYRLRTYILREIKYFFN